MSLKATVTVLSTDIFARAFGQIAVPRAISAVANALFVRQSGVKLVGEAPVVATSILNTPVYDILTFKKNDSDEGFTFPYTIVINVRKRKRIVETSLTGRDGEILEYINKSNPSINIRGVIPGDSMAYLNLQLVAEMEDYLDHVGTLIVESEYLNSLNIKAAVVKDWDFSPIAGANYLPFVIEMIANDPDEYKVLANEFLLATIG